MALPLAAAAVSAGASIVGGILGRRSARKQARMQRQIADYNARIIETNAKAEAANLETQRKRFTKTQREGLAQARMSVASRGGQYKGSDMSALLEYGKNQQLDQLELVRKKDSVLTQGRSEAAGTRYSGAVQARSTRMEGDLAFAKGLLGAATTMAQVKDWSPTGVSSYGSRTAPTIANQPYTPPTNTLFNPMKSSFNVASQYGMTPTLDAIRKAGINF
jgi:hypothetical protein